ncbi:hypothetical protein BCV69DRAFT_282187 [Microstroma glucosiphilum]|uniref:Uncharacterized protein n=1 Tax=Pseudomicrostroma glucosiphilum TaxID=1684307 RepID=A0A316UEE2_9BASI|nr:hypothetical protein BCV69DRAFT_282187 [Pseudomicrostroma glucosiphilum]PWN21465.1 hypothetical protein BCV69DRAFT_282187 [Pseudomicrostroma glucosiphilum]
MAGISRRYSAVSLLLPQKHYALQQAIPCLPASWSTLRSAPPPRPHVGYFSTTRSQEKRRTRRDEADKRPSLSYWVNSRLVVYEEEILANPFYRMLASPLRRCVITKQVMPKDLLISLKPVFLPPDPLEDEEGGNTPVGKAKALEEAFVPDNILHPYFVPSKPGPSAYFCATKSFLRDLINNSQARRSSSAAPSSESSRASKGKGQNHLRLVSPTAYLPDRIEAMITHQLQTRVLQEVELLLTRRGEDNEARRVLLIQSRGKPPTSILDFSPSTLSSSLAPEGRGAEVALPLHYRVHAIFTPQQAVTLKEELGLFLDIEVGEKVGLPQTAVLGPLAVALWRLRNWVVGDGRGIDDEDDE